MAGQAGRGGMSGSGGMSGGGGRAGGGGRSGRSGRGGRAGGAGGGGSAATPGGGGGPWPGAGGFATAVAEPISSAAATSPERNAPRRVLSVMTISLRKPVLTHARVARPPRTTESLGGLPFAILKALR